MTLDERSTRQEIDLAHPDIAVLGVGAIEQHGRHLPVGTDWMIISELSRRVAGELNALLLPAIPFSMSECHGLLGGTVWLKPATLAAVIQDIASSLFAQGIYKLLLVNGHGGNFILEPAIQDIHQKIPKMKIVMPSDLWPLADGAGAIFEAPENDLHAGEIETSILLYLNSALVGPERGDFSPTVGREFLDYVTIDLINPQGVWGAASRGSFEKGERTFTAQVSAITASARQVFGSEPCC